MFQKIILLTLILNKQVQSKIKQILPTEVKYNDLDEHTLVTDNAIFPYEAAILKMTRYLCAGALIHEQWVLTAADDLYLLEEETRLLRVRLGSINYKKGGILLPVKYVDIHPNFDDSIPTFDIALIRLARSVRFTPSLRPVKLQTVNKDADATHFVVTSWPYHVKYSDELDVISSMEMIKRRRILTVTHLHPTNPEDCDEELSLIGVNNTDNVMCLDTGVMMDPCMRDAGAPVVLNDVLWGIVSSWKPANCEDDLAGPTLVTLVAADKIGPWIIDTMRETHKMYYKKL